ncbi:BioY protein [Thermoplasmatales archaeon SG8-52-4]|nr:MAG: BioY protein [Thermoplasmatales archaeon SG8-52-4]
MEITLYINKYKELRYKFYKWKYETGYIYKLLLAFNFALLTALLAQVRFYLPGNAFVPITGQTFAVLLAGVILGRWGGISQIMYVGLGATGLPWFANITGTTIGYLIGFILASFFIGYITEKYVKSRMLYGMLPLMFFTTFVLIYLPGLTYLYFYMNSIGISLNILELLSIAVIPFIIGDIIKAVAAAFFAKAMIPKKSYGREVDIV